MVSANPTGPDHGRLGAQRRLRRLRRAAARVRGPRGRARVLLQRRRRADGPLPRLGRGASGAGRSRPRTATTGDYIAELAAARRATRCRRCSSRSRRALERFRIHFDSWALQSELEQRAPRAARPARHVREGRRGLGALDARTATRRTACSIRSEHGGTPTYCAADVVYLRRQARARLRPRDLRARRRPPRLRRSWYGASRAMLGYDPDRVEVLIYQLVHLTARRRGDEDVEAARRRRLPRRVRRRDRRRRGALVPRLARPRPDDRRSTSTSRARRARRTRSTTSSTRTRGSPGSCATPRARPPSARAAGGARRRGARPRQAPRRVPGASSPRRPSGAAPHALPTYAIRLADDFHRFYHHHRVLGTRGGGLPARPRARRRSP